MINWKSDTCSCDWTMFLEENTEDNWLGEAVHKCAAHNNPNEALASNRSKNTIVNTILSALSIQWNDPEKSVRFVFDENTNSFTYYLDGFTNEDIDVVNSLNLDINIG